MKNRKLVTGVTLSVLSLSLFLVGCDREVSKDTSTSVSSDGTVKTKEKTVTQAPDGTIKTEETKKTEMP